MANFLAVADRCAADMGAAVHHQAANHSLGQVDGLACLALNVDPLLGAGDLNLPLVAAAGIPLRTDRDFLMFKEFYLRYSLALISNGKIITCGTDHREVGQKQNCSQEGRQDALIQFRHKSALLSAIIDTGYKLPAQLQCQLSRSSSH